MDSDFITTKTTELRTAVQAGNTSRTAEILTETILESGLSFEDTIHALTTTDQRQN